MKTIIISVFLLSWSTMGMAPAAKHGMEDKIWIHLFNRNEDGNYFTDGEGYYFSSGDNVLYEYPDVDHLLKKRETLPLLHLTEWKNEGTYGFDGKRVVITTEDRQEEIFSIELSGDTIMWHWQFARLTLRKVGSEEIYTLFHPEKLIGVKEK